MSGSLSGGTANGIVRASGIFFILIAGLQSNTRAQSISWNIGSGVWNNSSSNWMGAASVYQEGDAVTFADVAGQTNSTIVIGNVANGGVAPSSITINNSTTSYTFEESNIINGSTGILKTGSGTATLQTDQNDYTGNTVINGGTFVIQTTTSNTINTSQAIVIGTSGTLDVTGVTGSGATGVAGLNLGPHQVVGGAGTVKGTLVVDSGSAISAGYSVALNTSAFNSIGTLAADQVAFTPGGTYAWKIADGTAGAGIGWDELTANSLSVTATSGSKFKIALSGLNGSSVGSPADVSVGNIYQWPIAKSASDILLNGVAAGNGAVLTGSASSLFALDTTGLSFGGALVNPAQFSLEAVTDGNGQDLDLVYDATPEPSAPVFFLVGAASVFVGRRRFI